MRDYIAEEALVAEAKKLGWTLKMKNSHATQRKVEIKMSKKTEPYGFTISNSILITPHPDCCGAKILSSISTTYNERIVGILIRAALLSTWGNGSLQYTCTNEQKNIETALKKNGFKLVQTVKNPKTRRNLMLYVYNQK